MLAVHDATAADRGFIDALLAREWGGPHMVSRGVVHDLRTVPSLVATRDGAPCGLATYVVTGDACEITSMDATAPHVGVGTALLDAVIARARGAGCKRLWLITTNDNLDALRFYQRRGLVLARVHANAIEQSRRLKPSIPLTGAHGIPIRDELELELHL